MIAVAQRCNSGVDLSARPGNNTWEYQRGAFLSPVVTILHTAYLVLKSNILINSTGQACLPLSSARTVISGQSTVVSSCTQGGSIPWMSPELRVPGSRPTKGSDCYALGVVVYEVLSGQVPLAPGPNVPPPVVGMVLRGERPERPQGGEWRLFTDAIWGVLEYCWKSDPNGQTSAQAVLPSLLPSSRTSGATEDEGTGGGGQQDDAGGESNVFSPSRLRLTPDSLRTADPPTGRGENRSQGSPRRRSQDRSGVNHSTFHGLTPCPRLTFNYPRITDPPTGHGNNGLPAIPPKASLMPASGTSHFISSTGRISNYPCGIQDPRTRATRGGGSFPVQATSYPPETVQQKNSGSKGGWLNKLFCGYCC